MVLSWSWDARAVPRNQAVTERDTREATAMIDSHRNPRLRRAALLAAALCLPAAARGQVVTDGTVGPARTLAGPNFDVTPDLGQTRGGNLFHSFGAFHVPARGSATFTGPATIANTLSRVTGGQPSAIDGVLRSEIAGANFQIPSDLVVKSQPIDIAKVIF